MNSDPFPLTTGRKGCHVSSSVIHLGFNVGFGRCGKPKIQCSATEGNNDGVTRDVTIPEME